MLKIGQNWGKLQIIPPSAQQRFAPLNESINCLRKNPTPFDHRPRYASQKLASQSNIS